MLDLAPGAKIPRITPAGACLIERANPFSDFCSHPGAKGGALELAPSATILGPELAL